jgi:hypothetical protein
MGIGKITKRGYLFDEEDLHAYVRVCAVYMLFQMMMMGEGEGEGRQL